MDRSKIPSILLALLAAVLFGASAPLSKLLLGGVEPILLAALLYLGSGAGLAFLNLLQASGRKATKKDAALKWSDAGWIAGMVLAGGVAAPIVLLFGLRATPASTASLLLNFEGVATTLVAALLFREAVGRRIWVAVAFVTVGCGLLTWAPGGEWGVSLGAAGVLLACLLWGIDNNLANRLSSRNPLTLVMVKCLGAGTFSLILAAWTGGAWPSGVPIVQALVLGFLSYGLSIVLFVLSMRGLGAARASAVFSVAPFIGAGLSFLVFGDDPDLRFFVALPLLAVGVLLVVGERHGHRHHHAALVHEHRHTHDDGHHGHGHPAGLAVEEHSHVHEHVPTEHVHPHTPDLHHRHPHETEGGPS